MITEVSRDLEYRVTFRREAGDDWPDLVRDRYPGSRASKQIRHRVSAVQVRVVLDEHGTLRVAGGVEITSAYRVRADGAPGAPLGAGYKYYDGPGVNDQAFVFRQAAREAAYASFVAWFASMLSGGRDGAAVLDAWRSGRELALRVLAGEEPDPEAAARELALFFTLVNAGPAANATHPEGGSHTMTGVITR